MADLSLVETANELTYTGLGASAGLTLVVQKRLDVLDVHETVPAALTTQTWMDIQAQLATRLL